ncbi:MAG: hypothetical protein SWX82_35655 [Cyanobacteriota bacterium]|nr:hypothetical protein [Cyanobacteriota bacterium]
MPNLSPTPVLPYSRTPLLPYSRTPHSNYTNATEFDIRGGLSPTKSKKTFLMQTLLIYYLLIAKTF